MSRWLDTCKRKQHPGVAASSPLAPDEVGLPFSFAVWEPVSNAHREMRVPLAERSPESPEVCLAGSLASGWVGPSTGAGADHAH
jgi:hypothetical protein